MLLHIKGIYLLSKQKHHEAISQLKEIDFNNYNNPEYYYHLALAYHSLHSRVLAYYYANQSLQFFTEKRCFSRVIETEILMMIQLEQEEYFEPNDSNYERLIDMTENFGLEHQRVMLIHNRGYEQVRQGNYGKASEFYKESMESRDPLSNYYLGSLEGYLNSLTLQGSYEIEDLLQLAEKGNSIAEKINDPTFRHFFHLHTYKLQNHTEKYYDYLETEAFPYFMKMGYGLTSEHYAIKLFDYHTEKGNLKKANHFANIIIEKKRRNNRLV